MKRISIASLGAVALIAGAAFSSQIPVVANVFEGGAAVAQNAAEEAKVQLRLTAEKKIISQDVQGQRKVTWKSLANGSQVQRGEVLRYSLLAANNGAEAVSNLKVNQPIPQGMAFVLNSATVKANSGAEITYSIDGGKTYVKNPTVEVKLADGTVETRPAPDTAYTHVRWNFGQSVPGKATVNGTYQVRVR